MIFKVLVFNVLIAVYCTLFTNIHVQVDEVMMLYCSLHWNF